MKERTDKWHPITQADVMMIEVYGKVPDGCEDYRHNLESSPLLFCLDNGDEGYVYTVVPKGHQINHNYYPDLVAWKVLDEYVPPCGETDGPVCRDYCFTGMYAGPDNRIMRRDIMVHGCMDMVAALGRAWKENMDCFEILIRP